jgi:[protein-PII] uridylyltransferase
LFFRIAGTLSANRINILSAWSHSIGDLAIGTFHVNDIPEGPLDDPIRWEKFRSDFSGVVRGEIDVDELVAARRQMRCVFPRASTPQFPLKVVIDNVASDRATIVEVHAHDRPGLLYDITRSLSAHSLDIVLTKIATEVDQAADVFYVRDENGEKIVDFDRLEAIENDLHNHLAAMEEAHFGTAADAAGSGSTSVITF